MRSAKETALVEFERNEPKRTWIMASRGETAASGSEKNTIQDWLDLGFEIKCMASATDGILVIAFEK